jgi:signal transduction histidine kinase
MSWMVMFYANIMSMRSELERESERRAATVIRLARAKELADAANRGKSVFLFKMSHEFRTPLNAVIGYSEILLEDVEISGASQRKGDLERIRAAGKHLLSLVTDVLDISKIESNLIELKNETFKVASLIDDIVSTCRPMVTTGQNRLVVQCPAELGSATTDQTKLRQAALNLVSNAAKFTKGGTIVLSAARERRASGDWIEIRVSDTGIGLSKEELARLFENFAQASTETSRKYGGTGLGLAISQKFCALMGGGIAVTSEVGHGSVFTICIPAIQVGSTGLDAVPVGEPTGSPALAMAH